MVGSLEEVAVEEENIHREANNGLVLLSCYVGENNRIGSLHA